jgi:hypothetical protein
VSDAGQLYADPKAREAVVETEKVRDYLLNPDHPEGKSKAVWFESLGYHRSRWRRLANDILRIARAGPEYSIESTAFGVKYIVSGVLGSDHERTGIGLTVWIIEGDKPPRLVPAYPAG